MDQQTTKDRLDDSSLKENQADYMRCISGTFFNLACMLYKAGRFSPAVLFLKQSCPLGDRALQLHEDVLVSKSHLDTAEKGLNKNSEAWAQLRKQRYKRWELLAVCYSKTNARRVKSPLICVLNNLY